MTKISSYTDLRSDLVVGRQHDVHSLHNSWKSIVKLVAVPASSEFNQEQMGPNPKGFPLLPESPTSTGAPPTSHSHFKSLPHPFPVKQVQR